MSFMIQGSFRLPFIVSACLCLVACDGDPEPSDASLADAAAPDAGGSDAGPMDAGPLCALSAIPAADPARCARETAGCVRGCFGDGDCIEACMQADTTAADPTTGRDCSNCTFERYLACADDNGCAQSVERYRCCELNCTSADDCASRCATELDAVFACGQGPRAQRCGEQLASASDGCYPPRFDDTACGDVELPVAPGPEDEPRCAAETASCVTACADDDLDCLLTCLADDMTEPSADGEDCLACTGREYSACVATAGCSDEVRLRVCCEQQACPEGSDENCGYLWCGEESNAADECGYVANPSCATGFAMAAGRCFPPR